MTPASAFARLSADLVVIWAWVALSPYVKKSATGKADDMNATWVSMGISTLWAANDSGPFSSIIDNTSPNNPAAVHERIGGNPALSQQSGKVVRGFRFKGQLDAPPLSQAVFAILRGIAPTELQLVYPGKSALDATNSVPSSNPYGFDWTMYESPLPIGMIPSGADWAQIDHPSYGGPRTVQTVQLQKNAAGGGRIFRASPATVEILVSDRPVLQASINRPVMNEGEVAVVTVSVGYGGVGDPIEGLALSLSAATGTEVAGYGGTMFYNKVTGITDGSGTVRFFVRGRSGASQQSLLLDIEESGITNVLHGTVGRGAPTQTPIITPSNFIRSTFQPALPYQIPVTVIARPSYPRPGECVVYPEIPSIPGVPTRTEVKDDLGWNAGANSIQSATGDFELAFDEIPFGTVGSVIGLVRSREIPVSDNQRITHGFYFTQSSGGRSIYYVMESGRPMAGPWNLQGNTRYRIQRVNGSVFYYAGDQLLYSSQQASTGEVIIGASLYATRDALPSTTPEGDCFWTQVLFASQVCEGGGPPVDIEPIRTYMPSADNGTIFVTWGECDEDFNCMPIRFMVDDSRQIGFYNDAGQWKVNGGISDYYPTDPGDYVDLVVNLYRHPRNSNLSAMGELPHWFTDYAEFIGQFNVNGLSVEQSNNGNIRPLLYGDANGLPSFDPAYQYMATIDYTVYSPSSEVLLSENCVGAIYDAAGEIGDVQPLKFSIVISPEGYAPYSIKMRGMYPAYIVGEDGAVLLYTVPYWSGVMGDFICGDFTASIDGQPPINIYAACS